MGVRKQSTANTTLKIQLRVGKETISNNAVTYYKIMGSAW